MQRQALKREEINTDKLNKLKDSINATCQQCIQRSNDKEDQKSFFDGLFSNGNAELVSILQKLISDMNELSKNESLSSPFETYADTLVLVYRVYTKLKDKKLEDVDVIKKLQSFLIDHLEPIEAADWLQEKRKEHFRSDDEDAMIKYAIDCLGTAKLYESDEIQAYCEKWEIDVSEGDYFLWKTLVKSYEEEFDLDSGLRYVVGLQHGLGLSFNDLLKTHTDRNDFLQQGVANDKVSIQNVHDDAYKEFLNYKFSPEGCKGGLEIKTMLNKIDDLFVAIQRNPADRASMAALFEAIKNTDLPSGIALFSKHLKDQIETLKNQLVIFTLKNLHQLCEDYMRNYIAKFHNDPNSNHEMPDIKCKQLLERFFDPMINNVIAPTSHILTGNPVYLDASLERAALLEFTLRYCNEKYLEQSIKKIVVDGDIAATIFSYLTADNVGEQVAKARFGQSSLKKALIAACGYYQDRKTSADEKRAAIVFMGSLLKLESPDFDSVIQEASNFIDGLVEKYKCEREDARESRFDIIGKSGLFAGAATCFGKSEAGYNALTNLFAPKSPKPEREVGSSLTPASTLHY